MTPDMNMKYIDLNNKLRVIKTKIIQNKQVLIDNFYYDTIYKNMNRYGFG